MTTLTTSDLITLARAAFAARGLHFDEVPQSIAMSYSGDVVITGVEGACAYAPRVSLKPNSQTAFGLLRRSMSTGSSSLRRGPSASGHCHRRNMRSDRLYSDWSRRVTSSGWASMSFRRRLISTLAASAMT